MKKYSYIFALCVSATLLFSCTKKEEAYIPGEPDQSSGYQVSFPEQKIVPSYEIDPSDPTASTVTITATRKNTTDAITVPIVIEQVPFDAPQVFQATDLVFEAGQETATFQVSFPDAEVGVEYTCHIMIDDPKYASMYASDSKPFASFTFLKVKWETIATGTLNSWWMGGLVPDVTLQHCETFPERYRFVDPFGYGVDLLFTTYGEEKEDDTGDKYYNCRVAPTFAYVHTSYGNVQFRDLGYWQGDDSYGTWNKYYPGDNYTVLNLQWYVSAGSFGWGPEKFVAD